MTDTLNIDVSGLTPEDVAHVLATVRSMRTGTTPLVEAPDSGFWAEAESTGWTLDLVLALREMLRSRGNEVQLDAFNQAIRNGGEISREEIFRIGNYGPKRQLKNWTKPFRRITSEFVEHGSLPEDAE